MKLRSNKLHIATADAINSIVSMGWMRFFCHSYRAALFCLSSSIIHLIKTTVNIYPDIFLKHRLLQNMYIVEHTEDSFFPTHANGLFLSVKPHHHF